MDRKKDGLQEYVREHSVELYQLLIQLAPIPAPSGKEEKRARFCQDWLKEQGADGVFVDEAGNVVWPYRAENSKLIVFDAHMDLVFPDLEPLPMREEGNRIFCPGVGDDSANLAVLLMTAKYVAECQPDTGEYGLLFVCGVGEEGLGNLKGARQVCQTYGNRIAAFYAFDLYMNEYTARAVGSLRYRVSVQAQGGHSYHCFGNTNANVLLAELILELYQIQVPIRGKTTYNVGMISGGTSVNTIAQKAELLYEIRSDDEEDLREMEELFQKHIKSFQEKLSGAAGSEVTCTEKQKPAPGQTEVQIGMSSAGANGSDKNMGCIAVELLGKRPCESGVDQERRQKLFSKVEQIVESVTGTRPVPVPCSTDCNIPLSMGIPSVCIGTCRGAGAHTREEYIEKDSLEEGLEIALSLVESCVL